LRAFGGYCRTLDTETAIALVRDPTCAV
jgi:hypothetical protein